MDRVETLASMMLVNFCMSESTIPVRALLDPCYRTSQVWETLTEYLQWTINLVDDSHYSDFVITSAYDPSQTQYVTVKEAKLSGGVTLAHTLKDSFTILQLAHPIFYCSGAVALVLGSEMYARIIRPRIISQPGLPVTQYTTFGSHVIGSYLVI